MHGKHGRESLDRDRPLLMTFLETCPPQPISQFGRRDSEKMEHFRGEAINSFGSDISQGSFTHHMNVELQSP